MSKLDLVTIDPSEIDEDDTTDILAFLLAKGIVFINTLTFDDEVEDKKLSKYARNAIGIYVNCNDLFFWGSADAIQLQYHQIINLYQHYLNEGVDIWCCKQRNLMPQKIIADSYRQSGFDIDSYGFEVNPSDKDFS
jgi:hypothetical protein